MAWEGFGSGYIADTSGSVNGMSIAEAADVNNGSYNYDTSTNNSWGVTDLMEAQRMAPYYPDNGNSWDANAAMMGISRGIDSAIRGYVAVKGAQAATYAGQNGRTYATIGRGGASVQLGGGLLPILLIGGALFLLAK